MATTYRDEERAADETSWAYTVAIPSKSYLESIAIGSATSERAVIESNQPPTTRRRYRRPVRLAKDLLRMSRPQFWLVSLVPYLLGIVLASRSLLPPVGAMPRAVLGVFLIGPVLWFSVLAVNDASDLPGDRLNPRKQRSPLVSGRVTARQALLWGWGTATVSVVAGFLVSPLFSVGAAVISTLSWAYSSPPLRLKEHRLADVGANAVALGLVAPAAGWSLLRPLAEFPWAIAGLGILLGAALYLPTLTIDRASDVAAGYTTSAVRYGAGTVYWLGTVLWGGAALLSMGLCWYDVVFPRQLFPVQCAIAVVMTGAYVSLNRRPSFPRLAILSSLFVLCSAAFVASYVG